MSILDDSGVRGCLRGFERRNAVTCDFNPNLSGESSVVLNHDEPGQPRCLNIHLITWVRACENPAAFQAAEALHCLC